VKNTGTPYEKLTQQVFDAIHKAEGITNIDVRQNVKLQGKVATHQIDVYWEFLQGGITYRTVVQCKDWQSGVKQEQLFAFKSVLDDLPDQPRGVVVSRGGFQEGAREFAKAHGILLYELREPRDADWDGYIREVHIEGRLLAPRVHAFEVVPDTAWIKAEKLRLGLGDAPIEVSYGGPLGRLHFFREDGTPLTNGGDLAEPLVPKVEGERARVRHEFEAPTFMETHHPVLTRMKVLAVEVDAELVLAMSLPILINVNQFVAFILKNVADGSFRSLDAEGKPVGKRR
jgi:hypothetical protein